LGVADPAPFLAGTGGTNYAVASAQTGSNGLDGVTDQLNYFAAAHPTGAPASALYTFWAGANDSDGKAAADNIYANIQTLSAAGGKTFLWLNLPVLNVAAAVFDAEYALDLAKLQSQGIDVIGVSVETLFGQILANPLAYGFTNVTDPAQGTSGNPNNYLFWDASGHPTTAADALVADLALADFLAPEPSSLTLAFCGLVSLLFATKSRWRGCLRFRD
jgi:phospholipase/lecithinase/hemolysin